MSKQTVRAKLHLSWQSSFVRFYKAISSTYYSVLLLFPQSSTDKFVAP